MQAVNDILSGPLRMDYVVRPAKREPDAARLDAFARELRVSTCTCSGCTGRIGLPPRWGQR